MIRSIIRDGAVAAAKGHGHARVEPRHVIYAVARYFRGRPQTSDLLPAARQRLEPRGTSHGAPELSGEAEALLESIRTEDDALAVLRDALQADRNEAAGPSRSIRTETEPERATRSSSTDPIPTPATEETTAAILVELEALIGLGPVKAQIRKVIAVVQANEERRKAGLAPVQPGLHLVFTGPPGTGKTTVARLVARLYATTGALPGAKFVEVGRTDLVAGYVGQTAIKTSEVIQRARPGVLFIDEAYALTPRYQEDFGAEAVATLVKAMEDHRDDLAVIAAGYSSEMAGFVESNPGLRSRFKTFIDFPNYSSQDLVQIFERFAREGNLQLQGGVLARAGEIFSRAVREKDFGNARFARSLFEQAYSRMAARAAADGLVTLGEVMEIAVPDLEWETTGGEQERRRIGFDESPAH